MDICELATPAILLDMDVLECNIRRYHDAARGSGKQIWPMTKTHKSKRIASMQKEAGATGFLCGTLDECEAFCDLGLPVMYAYPPAGERNLQRVVSLAKRCDLILRLDTFEGAKEIDRMLRAYDAGAGYTVIIDSGLHRFGMKPAEAGEFVSLLKKRCPGLRFRGVSTHPGHVYGAASPEEVPAYAIQERAAAEEALAALRSAGFEPELVTSGSTPTFFSMCSESAYNVLHPGNYVFHDSIQIANGSAGVEDCALTVAASVISRPAQDRLLIDAGAKCLGLDMGAHGCSSVRGHGTVIGHPELTIYSLSEEVGKVHIEGDTDLKIGDMIRIIPNHSCATANNTGFYMSCRGGSVTGEIPVDVRGNARTRL